MESQEQRNISKKIGDYLLEEKICDTETIQKALEQQSVLRDKGVFKPLAAIIIEEACLTPWYLDRVLARMHVDILSSTSIFGSIPQESLQKTVSIVELRVLPEDVVIFNKGDEGDTFFIIISGKIPPIRKRKGALRFWLISSSSWNALKGRTAS